jgi:hypothetical protein
LVVEEMKAMSPVRKEESESKDAVLAVGLSRYAGVYGGAADAESERTGNSKN